MVWDSVLIRLNESTGSEGDDLCAYGPKWDLWCAAISREGGD